MFLSIFYYCLIKLLHFFLYKTKDCHWLLKKCYNFLRDQARWRCWCWWSPCLCGCTAAASVHDQRVLGQLGVAAQRGLDLFL